MFGLMAGLMGVRVAGAALNLLTQVAFAKIFVPSDVGIIMLCMSSVALVSLFAELGYTWLSFTQLPRMETKGLRIFWPRYHSAILQDASKSYVLIVAITIAALIFAPISEPIKLTLLFACICAPGSMFLRYNSAVANSVRRFSLSAVPDFIFRPGILLVVVVAAFLVGMPLTVLQTMIVFTVAMYVVSIAQAVILGKDGALLSYWHRRRNSFTRVLRSRALPLAFIAAVATSFSDIITLTAGLLLPSDDVASLAVAVRLAAIAGFVIQVAQQFVLPDLTQAVTQRNASQVYQLLTRLNALTISVIIAGLIATWLLGAFVLSFFGPHYVAAQNLLLAFMVGQSIRAFSGMNQQLLSMAGLQNKTVISCVTALLFFVGCSTLLVPYFGFMALGYAVIAAELAWSMMLASQALRLTGRRGDIFWLLANKPAL
jgi:O-antigen/teichoic acid export membrane protein